MVRKTSWETEKLKICHLSHCKTIFFPGEGFFKNKPKFQPTNEVFFSELTKIWEISGFSVEEFPQKRLRSFKRRIDRLLKTLSSEWKKATKTFIFGFPNVNGKLCWGFLLKWRTWITFWTFLPLLVLSLGTISSGIIIVLLSWTSIGQWPFLESAS